VPISESAAPGNKDEVSIGRCTTPSRPSAPEAIAPPLQAQAGLGQGGVDPMLEPGALPGADPAGAGEIPRIPEQAGRDPPRGERPGPWPPVRPRASSVSVVFTLPSLRLVLRAWTRGGTWPAASISSTIQGQVPTVSTATSEPPGQGARNDCRAPRTGTIRPACRP